ncbi:hypothetical protein D3C73_949760 [compost metagenome]
MRLQDGLQCAERDQLCQRAGVFIHRCIHQHGNTQRLRQQCVSGDSLISKGVATDIVIHHAGTLCGAPVAEIFIQVSQIYRAAHQVADKTGALCQRNDRQHPSGDTLRDTVAKDHW